MYEKQTIQLRDILLSLITLSFLAYSGQLSPILAQSGVRGSAAHRRALQDHRAEPGLSHVEFVRLLRALDLDAKQRHDIRAIVKRYESKARFRDNELRRLDLAESQDDAGDGASGKRGELRDTITKATESMQAEVKAVLTADQRNRLGDLMSNQNKRPKIRKIQDRRTNRSE